MLEMLLQRLVQDLNARVAPCSPEEIEEIMMDPSPQAQAMDEDKTNVEKSIQIQKDDARSSKANWGKGLVFPEDLNIPNDPNL